MGYFWSHVDIKSFDDNNLCVRYSSVYPDGGSCLSSGTKIGCLSTSFFSVITVAVSMVSIIDTAISFV